MSLHLGDMMYCSYHDGSNEDANCACTCNTTRPVPKTLSQAEALIKVDPGAMLTFIADDLLDIHILTYVVEDLQMVPDSHRQYTDKKYTVCDTVIGLLYHPSIIVREGAVLSVAQYKCQHARIHLVNLFYDPSQSLREMARDLFPHVTRRYL